SPDLVTLLQAIRDRVGAITVRDGYRHPAYNTKVAGKPDSRHLSGESVSIQSATKKPLQLAEIALEESGGGIGLGIGGTHLRIDVRGETAAWVESGATMSTPEFETWVDEFIANLGERSVRGRGVSRRGDEKSSPDASATSEESPRIIGPETYDAKGDSPTFMIKPGKNRYIAIEVVAADPNLFLREKSGAARTDRNAYGSWVDGLIEADGALKYQLPTAVWERMRGAERLYYRAMSTSERDREWPDLRTSTPDSLAETAPSITLKHERNARGGTARNGIGEVSGVPAQARRLRSDEDLWRNG
ncbi:MAG: D-Ala-D-Ala carboxypeptidase family metallohydrolase, partial [Armatimonadota bacterium]